MKNQNGITLIALVITIIVLLILAGISIAMLTGDNGLLGKSQTAVSDNAIAGAKDEISTEVQAGMATYLQNKYANNSSDTAFATMEKQLIGDSTRLKLVDGTAVKVNGCDVTIALTKTGDPEKTSKITITIAKDKRTVEGEIKSDGTLTWEDITDKT